MEGKQFANIIVDISQEKLDKTFQYLVPEELQSELTVGMQVEIPFGNGNARRKGYVLELTDKAEFDLEKMKAITAIRDKGTAIETQLIKLADWMRIHYGSTMIQALRTVIPVKQKVKKRGEGYLESLPQVESEPPKELNTGQRAIVEAILSDYQEGRKKPALIFGVTGSGKTEVYMELIAGMIAAGKSAILLIPEISLTYLTILRFYARFGERVGVLHSKMSAGERYSQFEKAKKGELSIMIGPRSALFTPFANLGMILIDEEHEGAYKSETTPRYHAREVAIKRAEDCGGMVVMGSATPSVVSFYHAKNGDYTLYRLTKRAVAESQMASTEIVDLREELQAGNKSIFSRKLQEAIRERLEKKEQVLLFLNRRGFANFISCRACGKAIKCPHCDVALKYHKDGSLKCHYCGFTAPLPKTCPTCGSPYMAGFGTGTQKVESMAKALFPKARILRMDMDTTSRKDGHEKILESFRQGEADILIGTQMIVKGHDFPNVTLVGVLAADLSLYSGDYEATERTFELLTQAAGRAGRGSLPGEVIIQTYSPDNYGVTQAAAQDYEGFYREEILYRRIMKYPPFAEILEIQVSGAYEELAEKCARLSAETIRKHFEKEEVQIIGPASRQIARVKDTFYQVLYVKHTDPNVLIRVKNHLEAFYEYTEAKKYVMISYEYK